MLHMMSCMNLLYRLVSLYMCVYVCLSVCLSVCMWMCMYIQISLYSTFIIHACIISLLVMSSVKASLICSVAY